MPRIWICINGILNRPGDSEGWTDRAVTWLHVRTADKAEKFEYAAGPLTRRLRQGWRAEAIAKMAGYYLRGGFRLSFIAHSNGAALVERVLPLLGGRDVASCHLFAPACVGDVLADAVRSRQIGSLHLYGSANDRALKLARISSRLLGWAGLGYGDLGIRIKPFAAEVPRTFAHQDDEQGHGTWFARGATFERTMQRIQINDQ